MPSLINRVTSFGRSQKGQSLIQKAMSRVSGGGDTRKTRRRGGTAGRRTRARAKR
jgi:hypothetical protein